MHLLNFFNQICNRFIILDFSYNYWLERRCWLKYIPFSSNAIEKHVLVFEFFWRHSLGLSWFWYCVLDFWYLIKPVQLSTVNFLLVLHVYFDIEASHSSTCNQRPTQWFCLLFYFLSCFLITKHSLLINLRMNHHIWALNWILRYREFLSSSLSSPFWSSSLNGHDVIELI